jgi:hypothetical protein
MIMSSVFRNVLGHQVKVWSDQTAGPRITRHINRLRTPQLQHTNFKIFRNYLKMSSLDAASLFGVKGLVAVITGGGTGIGLMMAKALEHNGAKVYIIGRRLETLQTAAKEAVCSSRPPNPLTYSPMVRNTATSSPFKGTLPRKRTCHEPSKRLPRTKASLTC